MTSETSLCRELTVKLENGLHLVPCSRIAEQVRDFNGSVHIRLRDQRIDAKSIFDLLTLRADYGTVLMVEVSGEGASDVMDGLAALFERNFEVE